MQPYPQYFSDKSLAARYEVSRSTIWRWTANGQLPKPVQINGSTRWRISDIEKWEKSEGAA
ncbi:helix-turn-helix domain-containing protein [Microbulbifer sp.]|uniref:helix-turn-helix transcriptional regulator n=1 Tax=Microbulbifer sp. TaxID=1908541 RepID=UPI00258ED58A|nr:helix-turn-helix domain-containing protein [Microbulbifer sp.]